MRIHHIILLLLISATSLWGQKKLDILIKNGRIIDGSGNPWFYGDIGIRKGKVFKIGHLKNHPAGKVIDAKNQVIAPGFIDVHGHIEGGILTRPKAENFLYDGVTSIVTGNCGGSRTDLQQFFREMERKGISMNVASLIGHNSVRTEIMGTENRAPSSEELEKMKALVEEAMKEGAVGFSTGLIYVPGTYSKTDEVVALAKVASEYGGVYASHMRNENNEIVEAIEEAVNIGREAQLPVQISHFKLGSKSMWHKSDMTIGLIEKYRNEGIDVTVDQYPYPASSTTLAIALPTWALAGGTDSLNARLEDPSTKAKIVEEMKKMLKERGNKDYEYAAVANCPFNPDFNGKRISEVNILMGRPDNVEQQIETVLDLVRKGPRVQMVYHSMNEEDVQYIMRAPFSMVASDAGIPNFGSGMPHPRAYGTNARVLGRYVRELKNLQLEDAIRKMTSLPAQKFNLVDRGLLRPGFAADVVIFDPEQVSDQATFEAPHAYSKGFSHVIVNGKIVIENGKHNGKAVGKVLKLER